MKQNNKKSFFLKDIKTKFILMFMFLLGALITENLSFIFAINIVKVALAIYIVISLAHLYKRIEQKEKQC